MSRDIRKFVKAELVAKSPIRLSSGDDQMTDSDVLVDATDVPFIPGSSLAGVMRHYVDQVRPGVANDNMTYAEKWFGRIVRFQDLGSQSRVWVHDAFPVAGTNPTVSTRDGVQLNENKVAMSQRKFNYQVVDTGARFELRLEVRYDSNSEAAGKEAYDLITLVLSGIRSGDVCVGGKTSRGFGELDVRNAQIRTIDLSSAVGVTDYVNFDWGSADFAPLALPDAHAELYEPEVKVELRQVSPLMIRDYATVARSGYENKLVDAETLKGSQGKPVIPGTSWAGTFRHHMATILRRAQYDDKNDRHDSAQMFLDRVFGNVGSAGAVASSIEFRESELDSAKELNCTRTAIDRFSGGAADQRLFTNRAAFGGTTELRIRWRKDMKETDKRLLQSLVSACVDDLCGGYLAVGGMTATGSGIFCKKEDER